MLIRLYSASPKIPPAFIFVPRPGLPSELGESTRSAAVSIWEPPTRVSSLSRKGSSRTKASRRSTAMRRRSTRRSRMSRIEMVEPTTEPIEEEQKPQQQSPVDELGVIQRRRPPTFSPPRPPPSPPHPSTIYMRRRRMFSYTSADFRNFNSSFDPRSSTYLMIQSTINFSNPDLSFLEGLWGGRAEPMGQAI